MSLRMLAGVVLASCLAFGAGCETIRRKNTGAHDTLQKLAVDPADYADPTDEVDTEWNRLGREARANRALERDPDPWWQRYFMSQKARDIERNMGIARPGE